jgi:hypothetical protein
MAQVTLIFRDLCFLYFIGGILLTSGVSFLIGSALREVKEEMTEYVFSFKEVELVF